MSKSHATGWPSDAPTAAQMKEFFDQVDSGRINRARVQGLIRAMPEPSNVFVSGEYVVRSVYSGPTAIALHREECGFEGKIDPDINDENYPQGSKSIVGLQSQTQTIRLLYFGRNISTREVLQWCELNCQIHTFRAVGAASILALGTEYPALRRYRIVGLGQFADIKQPRGHSELSAVCFQSEHQKREAWTMPEHVWLDDDPDIYFAVEQRKRLI